MKKKNMIKKSYDAKLYIPDITKHIEEFIHVTQFKCNTYSRILYNIYYNKHYLLNIGDTKFEDIHPEIRLFIKNSIDKNLSNQNIRDIFRTLDISSKQMKQLTDYKEGGIKNSHILKQKFNCHFVFPLINNIQFSKSDTLEMDSGFAHTLSYISNTNNWHEAVKTRKVKKENYLQNNLEYKNLRPFIRQLEDKIIEKTKNNFLLTHESYQSQDIKNIISSIKDFPALSKEIINNHRYYSKNIGKVSKKPTFNPTSPFPYFPKDNYKLDIINKNNNFVSVNVNFYSDFAKIFGKSVYKMTIRPFENIENFNGIQLLKLDRENQCLYVKIIYSNEKNKTDKAVNYSETAFLDLGYSRPSVMFVNNKTVILNLFDNVKSFPKFNKYTPLQLRNKQYNYRKTHAEQNISKIINTLKYHNCKSIIVEKAISPSKKFNAPKIGRKLEQAGNRKKAQIRLVMFLDLLKIKCEENGIYYRNFTFTNPYNKDEFYKPSFTCPKCNKDSIKRLNPNTNNETYCGTKGVCENCNFEIMNTDSMAARNMARANHPDKNKRLPYFGRKPKISKKDIRIQKDL